MADDKGAAPAAVVKKLPLVVEQVGKKSDAALAHFMKASRQILDDAAHLRTYIDGRLGRAQARQRPCRIS